MNIGSHIPKITVRQSTKLKIKEILRRSLSNNTPSNEYITGVTLIQSETNKTESRTQHTGSDKSVATYTRNQIIQSKNDVSSNKRVLYRTGSDFLYTQKRVKSNEETDTDGYDFKGLTTLKADNVGMSDKKDLCLDQGNQCLSEGINAIENTEKDNSIGINPDSSKKDCKSTARGKSRKRSRKKVKRGDFEGGNYSKEEECNKEAGASFKPSKRRNKILCKNKLEDNPLGPNPEDQKHKNLKGEKDQIVDAESSEKLHVSQDSKDVIKVSMETSVDIVSTETDKKDDKDLSEISSSRQRETKFKKGKEKRPRPNFFIAIRIKDALIIDKVKKLQEAVIEYDNVFEKAVVPISTLHLTLLVFNAQNTEEEDNAKRALVSCKDSLNRLLSSYSTKLNFEGVRTFRGEVIFISLSDGDGKEAVSKIASELYHAFQEQGVRLTDEKDSFKPHLTALKLSRKFDFFRRKKIRRIPVEAYKEFVNDHFGTDYVDSLLLCSMMSKTDDGFYTYIEEVKLLQTKNEVQQDDRKKESDDLSSSWDVVSSTETNVAPTPLSTSKTQLKFCAIL